MLSVDDISRPCHRWAADVYDAFLKDSDSRADRPLDESQGKEIEAVFKAAMGVSRRYALPEPTLKEVLATKREAAGRPDFASYWATSLILRMLSRSTLYPRPRTDAERRSLPDPAFALPPLHPLERRLYDAFMKTAAFRAGRSLQEWDAAEDRAMRAATKKVAEEIGAPCLSHREIEAARLEAECTLNYGASWARGVRARLHARLPTVRPKRVAPESVFTMEHNVWPAAPQ